MTRKRWLLLGLLTLGVGGVVMLVLALLPARPGITKENFDRIEIGMPRAEVEEFLGGPPNGVNLVILDFTEWENDYGDAAILTFDDQGLVKSMYWDGWPDDRTVWQRLWDRMPWREREKHARFRGRIL